MPIPKDLLDIMACAFCKADLRLEGEKLHCTDKECGIVYPIKDDIPIMLIDEAERPCPQCSAQRDWDNDVLKCPKCGATFKYERK
jgi:uncharacterized protein YbaR (Trm112 family)